MRWASQDSQGTPVIYLVGRQPIDSSFQQLHLETLRIVIGEALGPDQKFELRYRDTNKGLEIAEVYKDISRDPRTLAVFDNSWGKDLLRLRVDEGNGSGPEASGGGSTSKFVLSSLKVPVFLLNGDHQYFEYGPSRVFLGNDDNTGRDIVALLDHLVKKQNIDPITQVLLIGESEGYPLFNELDVKLNDAYDTDGLSKENIGLSLDGESLPDRSEVDKVKTKVRALIDRVKEAKGHLAVVMICHNTWGDYLLEWFNDELAKTGVPMSVVAFSSTVQRGDVYFSDSDKSKLYLMANMPWTVSDRILDVYQRVLVANPKLRRDPSGVVFVRRCVVGSDLLRQALDYERNRGGQIRYGTKHAGQVAHRHLREVCSRDVATSTGRITLRPIETKPKDLTGQEKRGERTDNETSVEERLARPIMLHAEGKIRVYPFQAVHLDISDQEAVSDSSGRRDFSTVPKIVPAVALRFDNVRITDIDLAKETFRARFHMEVTVDPSQLPPSKNKEILSDEERVQAGHKLFGTDDAILKVGGVHDDSLDIQRVGFREGRAGMTTYLFRVYGTFIGEFEARGFPFDSQRLSIPIALTKPDNMWRLLVLDFTAPTQQGDRKDRAAGWNVREANVFLIRKTNQLDHEYELSNVRQLHEAELRFTLDRIWTRWLIRVIGPLFFLIILAMCCIWAGGSIYAKAEDAGPILRLRAELALGQVLTLAAYLVSYGRIVPDVEEYTRADRLVVVAILFSMFAFAYVSLLAPRQLMVRGRYHALAIGASSLAILAAVLVLVL